MYMLKKDTGLYVMCFLVISMNHIGSAGGLSDTQMWQINIFCNYI